MVQDDKIEADSMEYPYRSGDELSKSDAIEILRDFDDGNLSVSELAEIYGKNERNISALIHGKSWFFLFADNPALRRYIH